jgi:hypothetical protein
MDEPLTLALKDQADVFRRVDELIKESIRTGDPLIALERVASLTSLERLAGLGKAKLLWEIKSRWETFHIEEEFRDFVTEHTGMCTATIDRYVLVWEMYARKMIPEKLSSQIMGRTMRDQVEIAKIADRVELDFGDWKKIAAAENGHALIEIKREITGEKPRKGGLVLQLRRNGDIEATDSEKKVHFVGYLDLDKAKEDENVAKAIERITRSAGILIE